MYNHKNYDGPVDTFDFHDGNRISRVSAIWMGKKISIPLRIDTSHGDEATMIQNLAVVRFTQSASSDLQKCKYALWTYFQTVYGKQ